MAAGPSTRWTRSSPSFRHAENAIRAPFFARRVSVLHFDPATLPLARLTRCPSRAIFQDVSVPDWEITELDGKFVLTEYLTMYRRVPRAARGHGPAGSFSFTFRDLALIPGSSFRPVH